MNTKRWALLFAAWMLIGSAAVFLGYLKKNHRQGSPGLKMIAQPVYDEDGEQVGNETVALPERVGEYQSRIIPVAKAETDWLPSDTTFAKRYYESDDAGFGLWLNVVMMGTDRSSIHKPQICLSGQGWSIETSELVTLPIREPHPYALPVMKLTASKEYQPPTGPKRKMMAVYVYWFVAEDHLTARHGERMWWMARHLVRTGELQRWAYVACLAMSEQGQTEATYERMASFLVTAVPEFQLATGSPTPPTPAASDSSGTRPGRFHSELHARGSGEPGDTKR